MVKINKIVFNGKEKIWEYKICPCRECPIYPLQKEWEDDTDIRNNKCYTSNCTYNKENVKQIADDIYLIRNSYHCVDCNEYYWKDELIEPICPNCLQDIR